MIYTDGTHLISSKSVEELHLFGKKVGLKREWFQEKKIPHYDITTKRMLNKCLKAGAIKVSAKSIVVLTRMVNVGAQCLCPGRMQYAPTNK